MLPPLNPKFKPTDAARAAVKNKVIDKVSDVLSVVPRMKAKNAIAKADGLVADIKLVREAKGTEDAGDQSDPLFRARANVSNYKSDLEASQKTRKRRSSSTGFLGRGI